MQTSLKLISSLYTWKKKYRNTFWMLSRCYTAVHMDWTSTRTSNNPKLQNFLNQYSILCLCHKVESRLGGKRIAWCAVCCVVLSGVSLGAKMQLFRVVCPLTRLAFITTCHVNRHLNMCITCDVCIELVVFTFSSSRG